MSDISVLNVRFQHADIGRSTRWSCIFSEKSFICK